MITRIKVHIYLLAFLASLGLFSCSSKHIGGPDPKTPFEIHEASYEGLTFKGLTSAEFPIAERNKFRYTFSDHQLREFSQREMWDQALDWMMLGILGNIGLTDAELSTITMDFPEVRYGFFSKMAPMEYGKTRSRFVGNGLVVALIPQCDSLERIDHITHIADEHRKNIGEMPDSFWVFEYDFQDTVCASQFWRSSTVNKREAFSTAYGYHQEAITSVADLDSLMQKIDDITYGNIEGKHLVLGGRKILARKYRGVTMEEIAAIWQAESEIQRKNKSIEPLDAFSVRLGAAKSGMSEEKYREAYDHQMGKRDGSGFSLDPDFDFAGLRKSFEEIEPFFQPIKNVSHMVKQIESSSDNKKDSLFNVAIEQMQHEGGLHNKWLADSVLIPMSETEYGYKLSPEGVALVEIGRTPRHCNAVVLALLTELDASIMGSDRILEVRNELGKDEIVPYLQMVEDLKTSESMRSRKLATLLEQKLYDHSFQQARYDGNLQGTLVGMHYFSTDLKAKIYHNDHLNSAPHISGFKHHLNTNPAWLTKTEVRKFNGIRTWFGLKAASRQYSKGKRELQFGRTAARIFSASSNELNPGMEVEAAAALEIPNNWWNNHFEEVSNNDQEYEILNQLLKWSEISVWLNGLGKGNELSGLNNVPVQRDLWFWDWVEEKNDLNFDDWRTLNELPRNTFGTKTEAMKLLRSRYIERFGGSNYFMEGGISGGSYEGVAEALSVNNRIPKVLRRGSLEYNNLSPSKLLLAEGQEFKFISLNESPAVERIWGATKKLRNGFSEVKPQSCFRSVKQVGNKTSLDLFAENQSKLGTIDIAREGKTVYVGFTGKSFDQSMDFASRIAMSNEPMRFLEESKMLGEIEAYTWVGRKGEYLCKLPDEERWLLLKIEKTPEVELAKDWDFRASGLTEYSNVILGRYVNADEATAIALAGNHKLPVINKSPVKIRNSLEGPDLASKLESELARADKTLLGEKAKDYGTTLDGLSERFRRAIPDIEAMPQFKLRKLISKANQFLEENAIDLESLLARRAQPRSAQVEECLNVLKARYARYADEFSPGVVIANLVEELEELEKVGSMELMLRELEYGNARLIVDDAPGLGNLDWNIPIQNQVANIMKGPRKPVFFKIVPQRLYGYKLQLTPSRQLLNFQAARFEPNGSYSLRLIGNSGDGGVGEPDKPRPLGTTPSGSPYTYYYVTYPKGTCNCDCNGMAL